MVTVPASIVKKGKLKVGNSLHVEYANKSVHFRPERKKKGSLLDMAGTLKVPNFDVLEFIRFIKERDYDD